MGRPGKQRPRDPRGSAEALNYQTARHAWVVPLGSAPVLAIGFMIRSSDNLPRWTRGWLAWSAFLPLATGALSIPGWLGGLGWAVSIAVFFTVLTAVGGIRWSVPQLRRGRYSRGLPLLFALTAGVALVGALVYPPTNIDTLWYRMPRVIQWLQAGRWHWLDTERWRLNSIAFGLELHWLPLAAWGASARLLALPNLISFLLLPGLLFRVFRQTGVDSHMARTAMWVVASGWCFVAQAGSTASDAFSAIYFLAALDGALCFGRSGRFAALGWSVLAAALLTNTKQTNLPLLLPWVVAFWPGRKHLIGVLRGAPGRIAGLALVALLISTAPLILANWLYTGSWTGTPAWANARWRPAHPWFALVIQIPILLQQNLQLPIMPGTDAWNAWVERWVSSERMAPWFQGFDLPGRLFAQIREHSAGLGCAPLLWAGWTWWAGRRPRSAASPAGGVGRWIAISTWLAGAVVLTQIGFLELARYFAPYYPLLLLPALRCPGAARLARWPFWRAVSGWVVAFGLVFSATLRHRPLASPPQLLLSGPLSQIGTFRRLGEGIQYQVGFGSQMSPLVALVPPGEAVGWAHDSPGEAEFAWPPGRRRLQLLRPDVGRADLEQSGLRWVVTSAINATNQPVALAEWAAERGGVVRATAPFVFWLGQPPTLYALVELPRAGARP